jgi:pyruvate,orthophosphate dikinase
VEFTIQDGTLFILQCRNGKRTGRAALGIAVDMFAEGIVTSDEAVLMVRHYVCVLLLLLLLSHLQL